MAGEEVSKRINQLEIFVRERYKDNPSTTERAYDKEYVRRLEELRGLYQKRNSLAVRDNLGWNASDAKRVQVYGEILKKLEDERQAVAEYLLTDPDR
jgi:hypothetical protein